MTKQEKVQEIQDLTSEITSVKNLYLTDIAGLDATQTTALRRACFNANIRLSVVKNTLLAKAMEASEKDFGELKSVLKGNTSLMISETGNAPAKLIKDFRKKSDKPLLKGAYIEETIYIGDDLRDCQAAYNAGCKSIFIGKKYKLSSLKKEAYPVSCSSTLTSSIDNIIQFYR